LPLIRYQELKLTATVRKCRVVLLKSENKGDSWRYFSTIAYDQESPGDGYTYEPAIAKLRNGDLLCILRSDYPGQPLYQCRSKDQGKTWSQPEKMGFNGVAPNIVVLDSGIAAVSFGRPGVHVALSDNHGQTWGHHMDIFTGGPGHVGPMIPGHASSPGTTGYTGLVEVTPNTLLLAYDHLGVLDLRTKETSLLNSIKTVERPVQAGIQTGFFPSFTDILFCERRRLVCGNLVSSSDSDLAILKTRRESGRGPPHSRTLRVARRI